MKSPTVCGSFLALLVVPVGSLLLVPVSKSVKRLAFAALLIGMLALALTQTRGAILSVTIASVIFLACTFYRGWLPTWTPAAALLLAALLALPLLHVVRQRVQKDDDGSAASRVYLSNIAAQIFADHPVLGVGANNGYLAALRVANSGPYRSEWFYTIHNKYLLILAETGLLGFAAYLAFLFSTLHRAWQTWRLGDRLLSSIALAMFAGIAGQMVHMGVEIFNSREQAQILCCCAGIVVGLTRLASTSTVTAVESTTPAGRLRLAAQHGT